MTMKTYCHLRLYDLAALPENSLILDTTGNSQIDGTFVFDKGLYQPFFGLTYLTGELAVSTIDTFSYVLLPFKVQSVLQQGDKVLLQSVPFMAELKGYTDLTDGSLRLAPNSFTQINLDPNREEWRVLNTDINPYLDEVFTSGGNLVPDTIYACQLSELL